MSYKNVKRVNKTDRIDVTAQRGGVAMLKRKDRENGISSILLSQNGNGEELSSEQAVIQGKWIYHKPSGKKLNLSKTNDDNIYLDSSSGTLYEVVKRDKNGAPIEVVVKDDSMDDSGDENNDSSDSGDEMDGSDSSDESDEEMGGVHDNYRYNNWDYYKNWTKESDGVQINSEYGPVSAFQNRGAPKIGSQKGNYNNVDLGDSYKEYVRGLRSGKESDAHIASDLLELGDTYITSDLEKRASAMLHTTVYLSEEWRKQGAAKIYRAFLRLIAEGSKTFDDFLSDFAFIKSADEGRYMVSRFKDVKNDDADIDDLSSNEKDIYNAMSPIAHGDFSSDEEMEEEKKLSKPRDHSKNYKTNSSSKKGFKNIWK